MATKEERADPCGAAVWKRQWFLGDFLFWPSRGEIVARDQATAISLTLQESRLLACLVSVNRYDDIWAEPVCYEDIISNTWPDGAVCEFSNRITTLICCINKKVGLRIIRAKSGFGAMLTVPVRPADRQSVAKFLYQHHSEKTAEPLPN